MDERTFMEEELQDMFNLTKAQAADVLEVAIMYPIALGKFRGVRTSYQAFKAGYNSDRDATFNAWKAVVEKIIEDLTPLKHELKAWERRKAAAREQRQFDRALSSLESLCRQLQLI